MDFFSIIIYGIVQGISEFLPVSSSGHLAILPKILTLKDPGVFFDLLMHVGTALSVIVYYRKNLFSLLMAFKAIILKKSHPQKNYCLNYITATIFTVGVVFSIKYYALSFGRNSVIIAINLIVFGLIMYISDKIQSNRRNQNGAILERQNIKTSMLIGISQALAIFPGVSRSGITFSAARLSKLSRKESADFSFLLSLPLIIGGALLSFKDPNLYNDSLNVSDCLIGIGISFIVGILSIHYFIKFIKNLGVFPFFVYRVVIGILVLIFI